MTTSLILLVGAIYLVTAAYFAIDGKYGMALTYLCYAIANIGLLLASKNI